MKLIAAFGLALALIGCAAPRSQTNELRLGTPFEDGLVAQGRGDYQTATQLFQRSASAGNAEAQSWLASMYSRGEGVTRDYSEAANWYRQAAEQGYAEAQANLGAMYALGRGVPRDYATAVTWYRKAAEQGHAGAQYNLASMYVLGRGVTKDYVQALKWFNISASRTEGVSRYMALEGVTDAASMMTPAQIREAHRLAAEWKPTKR